MNITDIFIKRPVLSTVVSLLILSLGLRAMGLLPIREYPETQNAVVTVSTLYTGADPDVIAGFITAPLEHAIAQANGIDYLTSKSAQGSSIIEAHLRLNYDVGKALTEINTKVNAVLGRLPKAAEVPTLSVAVGQTIDSMYIGFYSDVLSANQITDYLMRVVQPNLQTVYGLQEAEILGGKAFAMRVWLNPQKLAGHGLTASDVYNALSANNFIAAIGRTKGQMVTVDLAVNTNLSALQDFKNLVVYAKNGAIVRLKDVAHVALGADNYDMDVRFDGTQAVYIGIKVAPSANVLSVIQRVKALFPHITGEFPEGLHAKIVYDATEYVHNAISEVLHALLEAILIVTVVIFLFLGSMRSVLIPLVTIPLSLIGAFFAMLLFGYSINLLTLLALVLAIGLVVDDAIIVVENVHRHIESGMSRMQAAVCGARELSNPIIAITVILIAVYLPIGFMGGITGALFTEFAFTLAAAVTLSAIIALTLSPMMCSQLLPDALSAKQGVKENRLAIWIDQQFDRLSSLYARLLAATLQHIPVVLVFLVLVFVSIDLLYRFSNAELAPQEDQGIVLAALTTAPNATLAQTQLYSNQLYKSVAPFPEIAHVFQLDGASGLNSSMMGFILKPWSKRAKDATVMQKEIQAKVNQVAGANIAVFQPSSLPGSGGGLPVQFVITTTQSFDKLDTISQKFLQEARKLGIFLFADTDLKRDKPRTILSIDRDKVAQMGLDMQSVGSALSAALGGGYVNYFNWAGRSYQVIPQLRQGDRLNQDQLLNYYITTANGMSVPLATVAHLKDQVTPETLNRFQQLNSATLSGVLFPGVTQGEALSALNKLAKKLLPTGYGVDYNSQSRQYMQEGSALLVTFFFALLIIFLALSALFESFRDPLIVLISVPLSVWGALIFIALGVGGASLNIYTEVGLVTLIGLISKHGILIVAFANELQLSGHSKRVAIQMASKIRLRPILMTAVSMVAGVTPLMLAHGAGAKSRFNIGLVIASGTAIGTLFTLFVVPAIYLILASVKKQTHCDLEPTDTNRDKPDASG